MKSRFVNIFGLFILFLSITLISFQQWSCASKRIAPVFPTDTLVTNETNSGWHLEITFQRGSEHNHPLMAVWITDTSNQYIETLYISESIAKGVFKHANNDSGKWEPGVIRRPAALPVWAHSRGVKEADGLYIPTQNTPIPDAITGATPQNNFILNTRTKAKMPEVFYLYFEINQSWDWNEFWTNSKFLNDEDYKTSCQPALVYRAYINPQSSENNYNLKLIGHSHYSGKDGEIDKDLSTITTAANITKSITARIIY